MNLIESVVDGMKLTMRNTGFLGLIVNSDPDDESSYILMLTNNEHYFKICSALQSNSTPPIDETFPVGDIDPGMENFTKFLALQESGEDFVIPLGYASDFAPKLHESLEVVKEKYEVKDENILIESPHGIGC